MDEQGVFRWVFDVRDLWLAPPDDRRGSFKPTSTAHWATGTDAQKALSLLFPSERDKVLRFVHPRDAKLALGSNLLKRRAIVDTCQVSWEDAVIGEDHNRKPSYRPSQPGAKRVEFNTSHHGTLVALVGSPGEQRQVGTDVVQVQWERDSPAVRKDGFEKWARTYEAVFSAREALDIARYSPPGRLSEDDQIRAKLRHFYAHWCLKEAYVKMTGEALLSPSLQDMEFRRVQVPLPLSQTSQEDRKGKWGQTCTDHDMWFKGVKVTHVKMELQAFGDDYMVATAVSDVAAKLCPFKELDVNLDVYP
jgi:4'-phosphopantetheinyl transferase